jgi:hypothetical protein
VPLYHGRVSIWTKPLFGKAPAATPAGRVAKRVAAMRAAAGADMMPWMMIGYVFGKALFILGAAGVLVSGSALSLPWQEKWAAFLKGVGFTPVLWSAGFVIFAFAWRWPMRWIARRQVARLSLEASRRSSRMRKRWMGWIAIPVSLVIMAVIVSVIASDRPASVLIGAGVFVCAWSLSSVGMGLSERRGAGVVCGRCEYPMGSWRGAGPACPECGIQWKDPWHARVGKRVRFGPMTRYGLVGLGLCAVMLAAVRVLMP